MAPIQNAAVLFNITPSGYPEPGKTTVYDSNRTIDIDTVPLSGGILLKTLVLSNDPYLRGRMRDPGIKYPAPAFVIGEPLDNWGVGRVLRSEDPKLKVGDHVTGYLKFQEYSVVSSTEISGLTILDNKENLPWSVYVGVAGMPGRSAYYAYREFSKAKKGETIFISTGAGAVGSLVIQLAKLDGLKVIASAGSDEKVQFMKSLGADVAFNYKTARTADVLEKEGPLDIYWDNVGGSTLDAALGNFNSFGRVISCGMISSYNTEIGYVFKNLSMITGKCLTVNGFIEPALTERWHDAFYAEIPPKIVSGQIKYKEEWTRGLEGAGEALRRIQTGENVGKSVILVSED